MDLSDRMRRQEGRPPVAVWHEDAIGRTHVQVHMAVERRAEAVQEEDGAVSRADGWEGVGVNRYACRSAQQPLDLLALVYDGNQTQLVLQRLLLVALLEPGRW
jgi:hypothetical protein